MRGTLLSLVIAGLWLGAPGHSAAMEDTRSYFIYRPEQRTVQLSMTPEEAARFAGGNDEGMFFEQEGFFHAAAIPNDPAYGSQSELTRIGAESLWSTGTGGADVVVAVIDSGVDLDHPDLAANIWTNDDETPGNGIDDDLNGYVDDRNGWDFASNTNDPGAKLDESYSSGENDGVNHGTVVSGVIGAVGNNGVGIAGVSWQVRIMSLRVLNSAGVGLTSSIVDALAYARQNGADVVNLSLVGSQYSAALDAAIQTLIDDNIIVVAATGNEGVSLDANPRYPACMEGVVGVASVNSADVRSSFSNYGAGCTDIAAPGENVYTTQVVLDAPGFDTAYAGGWAGTSLATPFVSGTVAVLKAAKPSWSAAAILGRIYDRALGLADTGLVGRRLALASLLSTADTVVTAENIITAPGPGGGPDVRIFDADGTKRKSILAYASSFRAGVNVAAGETHATGSGEEIVTGPFAGGGPHVRVFSRDGTVQSQFFAYASSFRGGVDVAVGDVDGNGDVEIITAPGPGGGPDVRVFDAYGTKRKSILAYASTSRTGVHVAAGDLDGNGQDEIVTAEMAGGTPLVKVFSGSGAQLYQFFAYASSFRGGVDVAVGDVDGNGEAEIITAPGPGGGPHIRIFSRNGTALGQFFAYASSFRGGVRVASGDVSGDGNEDIVVGPMAGGGPHVRTFAGNGTVIAQFFAYPGTFRGGVDVAVGRIF